MKILTFAVIFVLCITSQAIMFSTIATVSMTLVSLNTPVDGFFGIFRRRQSPVQETVAPEETQPPFKFPGQQSMTGGFNAFGGLGGGNAFMPGFNAPSFGMFGQNRFPPQFRPPQQMPPRQQVPSHQQMPPRQQMQTPQQMSNQNFPPQQSQMSNQNFPPQQSQQMPNQNFPPQQSQMQFQSSMSESDFNMDDFKDSQGDDVPPGMNTEEAESFFTLLSETDESKCISRLVCEMGANPENGGEFGETIADIIGSLNDFPDGSKVSEYNDILNSGRQDGLSACTSKYAICDEESYQLVKTSQADGEEQSS